MSRVLMSCFVLGISCFSPSYAGKSDVPGFLPCVQHYRSAPLEDHQRRHLSPLPREVKNIVLPPLEAELLKRDPQEASHPDLFHLLHRVEELKENPQASGLDVLLCHLEFSASLGPWREGDHTLSLLFQAAKQTRHLAFDSRVSPQKEVESIGKLMRQEEKPGVQKRMSQAGALFYPVVGEQCFDPGFLAECFIQNVFPVAISTQHESYTHGLYTSSLVHALHDIGHGLVAMYKKCRKLEKALNKLREGAPFDHMTAEEEEIFQAHALDFLFRKNEAYEVALLEMFNCFKGQGEQGDKLTLAAMFFIIHEAGIRGWPDPLSMPPDVGHVTQVFLEKAAQAFQKYYEGPQGTSPKDGTVDDPGAVLANVPDGMVPEGATPSIVSHGLVVEVQWDGESGRVAFPAVTQNWIFWESQSAQRMLRWAFGGASHPFHLPTPADSEDKEAFQFYNQTTLEGIKYVLQQAQGKIAALLVSSQGQAIQETFAGKLKGLLKKEFLQSLQREFGEKSYGSLLEKKVSDILQDGNTS